MKRDLLSWIANWLKSLPHEAAIKVAYSGGRDSHVLLHILWQLRAKMPSLPVSAIHVNHGLQAISTQWANHCQSICEAYQIPFLLIPLQLKVPPGESLENVARTHRYAAFSSHLQERDILVTAHTQDDQAETFLLQLIRGSGPLGLAGIAPLKTLGKGQLARPLLTISKKDITHYAEQHQLNWVEDPTNTDIRFRRNFLRHEILPKLESLDIGVITSIARSSQHCANSQQLLEEYLRKDLMNCLGATPVTLNLLSLKKFSRFKQEALLRLWLKDQGIVSPSTKKLRVILDQMFMAKEDAMPCVTWGNKQIKRYKAHLHLLPLANDNGRFLLPLEWRLASPLVLPSAVFRAKQTEGAGLSLPKTGPQSLQCRFREGGERCRPVGQSHSAPLKKILQRLNIPTWERQTLPLFYYGQNLVAVADLFICEGWQVQSPDERGWQIEKLIN